jgi:hypothetical protein
MCYYDPAAAFLGPTNSLGCVIILALHLYHIIFYRPLPMVDW